MPKTKKRPKLDQWASPQHYDDEPPDAIQLFDGLEFRRYSGRWCSVTQAGTWRPTVTMRACPSVDALLDHIYRVAPERPKSTTVIPGQESLL